MQHSAGAEEVALDVAKNWAEVEKLARRGVKAADVVQTITSPHLLTALTDVARSVVSEDLASHRSWPHAARRSRRPSCKRDARVRQPRVFPACINRIFGRDNFAKPASPALYPRRSWLFLNARASLSGFPV